MAGPEAAQEGLGLWQGLGAAGTTAVAVGTAIIFRIIGKKDEPAVAGDSGKHLVLEQATLADAGPFVQMAKDIAAIRALLEEQVRFQKEQKQQERVEGLEDSVRGLQQMIATLIRDGADHKPGRPLRDE